MRQCNDTDILQPCYRCSTPDHLPPGAVISKTHSELIPRVQSQRFCQQQRSITVVYSLYSQQVAIQISNPNCKKKVSQQIKSIQSAIHTRSLTSLGDKMFVRTLFRLESLFVLHVHMLPASIRTSMTIARLCRPDSCSVRYMVLKARTCPKSVGKIEERMLCMLLSGCVPSMSNLFRLLLYTGRDELPEMNVHACSSFAVDFPPKIDL